ncbi:MAG: hypothetical protein JXR83_15250 [Deltaproteobacteria bacterium]|nr:hypothetical protein [Deltaproteobacteria bacterium]
MRRLLTTVAVLLGLGACFPIGPDGQRVCRDPVTCADLVKLTCGADDRCAAEGSCTAARRLEQQGDDGACRSAWCDLGESYRACP